MTPKMTPAHPQQNNQTHGKKPEQDAKYLSYEWSKGYLPTENPKPDEIDLPEERNK
jgi:hypothetical protein